MPDLSNFGTLLKTSASGSGTYTAVAGLVKLEPPTIKNPKIDSTAHDSGTFKKAIYSNSVEISDFKGTFSMSGCAVDIFSGSLINGTPGYFQLYFPSTKTWTFPALVTEFGVTGADAQSPDLLQAEVTFSPSGSLVIA